MSIISAAKRALGIPTTFKRNALNEVVVLIHKDARFVRPHGVIVATHRGMGIKEAEVVFAFADYDTPPVLNHRTMNDIWESFHSQGWIPINLVHYGLPEDPIVRNPDFAGLPLEPSFASPADNAVNAYSPMKSAMAASIDPRFDDMLDAYKSRHQGYSEDDQEVAAIRYDQIVANSKARKETLEVTRGRMEQAFIELTQTARSLPLDPSQRKQTTATH